MCPPLLQGKVGVSVTKKRSANQESSFSSYLQDLRSRCDTLAQTPVKRLKVKKNTDNQMKVLSQSLKLVFNVRLSVVAVRYKPHPEPVSSNRSHTTQLHRKQS